MNFEEFNNDHIRFKTDSFGNKYSLTDDNGIVRLRGVLSPEVLGDSFTQIDSVIARLDALLETEGFNGGVVHQVVFLKEIGDKQLARQKMIEYYRSDLPAISYVAQKPCDGAALLIEIEAIKDSGSGAVIRRYGEHVAAIETPETTVMMVGDLVPGPEGVGAYARSWSTFEKMRHHLQKHNFTMADILRTWIYQGHIVLQEKESQRYKELNHARTDFFEGIAFLKSLLPNIKLGDIYPASTGIGADDVDVTMAALAIRTKRNDVIAVPLENPDQTPAFDYGAVYSPKSPKFSRAMALAYDGHCTVYVSGTASITDSETRFVGDPGGQAAQTLDNIEALISGDNLAAHGIAGFDAELEDLVIARVYVKRPEYYAAIRSVCEKRFSQTPIIYTLADVCRDDLLVEIEGVTSCKRPDKN